MMTIWFPVICDMKSLPFFITCNWPDKETKIAVSKAKYAMPIQTYVQSPTVLVASINCFSFIILNGFLVSF